MNVTNRRKSTDTTETPLPTQTTQQSQQLLAYVSCRQAATATATAAASASATRTRQEQQQSIQNRDDEVLENNNDDQEQVVTSTSSDCLLPLVAEGEGEEVILELDTTITSPARITSSTNNYEILTYNSDSLSREDMPSTSVNSRLNIRDNSTQAATINTITHHHHQQQKQQQQQHQHQHQHHSINTRSLKSNNEMVARDINPTTVVEAGDSSGARAADGGAASTSSSNSSDVTNENHKIILKLPKPSLAAPTTESPHHSNSLIEDDLRKVEPLKINLHNTHHTPHHTPKITIKPIVKESPGDMLMSSEECSSSAEDEMVSKLNASELHIVPKLTIRAKNEEHSTVVPKLTIKINDSAANNSGDSHSTHPAANTPPLPKLTIKTGQDGHSESIITNISPASSTTSSSSSSFSSSTSTNSLLTINSSTTNVIPKLTIKPLQKTHETTITEHHHHPSIPKLCIKGHMICGNEMTTVEDATTSKIPKLTIKTGQEHAVIITQHNDNAKIMGGGGCGGSSSSSGGGIPKLTIKTKSLDTTDDSNNSNLNNNADNSPNEKIPKITIKTNNMDTPNIILSKRNIIKSSQLDIKPLSPKQAVPKLTITRQQNDMVVTNKHTTNANEECTGSIPKMTIKTQNKAEIVPKLTIKNIANQQRTSSPEDEEEEEEEEESDNENFKGKRTAGTNITTTTSTSIKSNVLLTQQHCKTVPKLTIKNLGSPQQKLTVVQEMPPTTDTNKTNNTLSGTVAVAGDLINVNLLTSSSPADGDEFADLLTVDNGGGESSNSQEFCGFNDNTADDSVQKNIFPTPHDYRVVPANNTETSRNSDDMDIDVDLQTAHEPKIFQNDLHFKSQSNEIPELLNGKIPHTKITQIIDTVDLTSSPSRSSSPAQFDYNEDSNMMSATNIRNLAINMSTIPNTNILLERLQREKTTTVIQNTHQLIHQQQQQQQQEHYEHHQQMENKSPIPPPLQPKPNVILQTSQSSSPASIKYPQLAERLMANGTSPNADIVSSNLNNINTTYNMPLKTLHSKDEENIVDSIEILDTPEGSPRNFLDDCSQNLQHLNDKTTTHLPNGLYYPKNNEIYALKNSNTNNNNKNNNSNLKRHALNTNLTCQLNQTNHAEENNIDEMATPPTKQRKLNNETVNIKNFHLIGNNSDLLMNQKVLNSLDELKETSVVGSVGSAVAAAATAAATAAASTVVIPPNDFNCLKQTSPVTFTTNHQRSRKQKHENLLPIAMEEVQTTNSSDSFDMSSQRKNNNKDKANETVATPVQKKRGRPKKSINAISSVNNDVMTTTIPAQKNELPQTELNSKSRRVQLLRKRLAIDMVDADEPLRVLDELESSVAAAGEENKNDNDRNLRTPLRTSRRSNTPTVAQMEFKARVRASPSLTIDNNNKKSSLLKQNNENSLNNFLESNSSIPPSSVCSNSSATLTSTVAAKTHTIPNLSMATQIDLTMSSSSSNSNGSITNTITTVEAAYSKQAPIMSSPMGCSILGSGSTTCVGIGGGGGGGGSSSSNNSMLPPTTILSSDPSPDVIFKHNDFSSILATQQFRAPIMSASDSFFNESQDEYTAEKVSGPDNSGDDSASSSSITTTPVRGRGRGRGSRGGRGRGYKAHRLGRNASAVSKAIAMNRPRCVGALKHTPDPDRIKGLYSPAPSVFEEDTRMSADLSQTLIQSETPQTIIKQPDFLNNEESQSSVISNSSILDPNNVAALQNGGSAVKKPMKRKKMEVCVAEDAELTVSSIAEYDWPPPKGCCPSKNRDTFMIQEQVALYLGIKSFKRKYPDLPRRQIDMEERNYLQEKNLVSEKMCDLGITAVWASDILDIMYTDFHSKYEEYKDFVRQKHLREIEAKQKSLGLNVAGRGLQARERAMLSTSKWNTYFNRIRKEERLACLDLQTLTVNKPCPASAPIAAITNRPIADAVARAAEAENITQPPTLLKENILEPIRPRDSYYPLSLVPGQFCEKYYNYSAQELRQFPLNTVLEFNRNVVSLSEDTTDTDSAAEIIGYTDGDKSTSISATERLNKQKRIRRIRAKHTRKLNNDEFKVPPLPGAASNSSTELSSSSSDDSSSDTDSDTSSCSSSSNTDSTSEDENSPATCGVCQHSQNRNLKDIPELFIQCYTCRRKVHPSCIEMPHRMANRVRYYNWQCADCKCCIKCKRKHDRNKMLFCEQCDRCFHIYCLSIKAIPDGRWSCERCSICMRCGASKPEGFPIMQSNGEKLKVKHRKLKWINEYRIDHITKLREHCSMLCVPCGRAKNIKRVQINTHHNTTNTYITSPGLNSSALSPNGLNIQSPPSPASILLPQISPTNTSSCTTTITTNSNVLNAATTTQCANTNHTITTTITTTSKAALSSNTSSITTSTNSAAKLLESKDSITDSSSLTNSITPQITANTAAIQTSTTTTINNTLYSSLNTNATTTTSSTTTTSGGAPPVVA